MDPNFSKKLENYYKHLNGNCIWIELTKCCGFSCFISIYKLSKLSDIYNNASCHLSNISIVNLYVNDDNGNKLIIPNDDMCVNDYLNLNRVFFKPIYPLPNDVVYRVFIECEMECNCKCQS